ncbi:nucleotidyltransferase family protein [Kineosporia sp. J2-2]|uniref:Nucleotidyltransferase family protein n=1 Tax=Kineosporia corallincola TaxID=2835133 RepID=A0ABS5T8T6_9ACTN|nr:nucleotidyltransferase family protein [Kineosporia corallincola]MBT0767460.1 nucleotidyltransferase family protein [Kineosporia corallincola]
MGTAGIVLAAGAGTRMGRPKGLCTDAHGVPWVRLAVEALVGGGCSPVFVVTGAQFEDVAQLVPAPAVPVRAADWAEGMSASLRRGLTAVSGLGDPCDPPDAAVVALVDMPDLTAPVVRRLLEHGTGPDALARAAYRGRPGHPVLLGRAHWPGVLASARGDAGARRYLRGRDDVLLVEAGDLASGLDRDTP